MKWEEDSILHNYIAWSKRYNGQRYNGFSNIKCSQKKLVKSMIFIIFIELRMENRKAKIAKR